ncbi:D-threo-aldose 1-dehydrogenase [Oopsacas minuta]|uniref:D-threo-aldose 1-dehydrogenase n=1 Tax=Oopsacas minuta TaxID=111878 RepID=A0AAV7JZA9_9METZ|nr:D-threo-aldose 1-dehydrogenase [Oopsacas minuta]
MEKRQLGRTDIFLGPFSIGTSTLGNVYGEVKFETAQKLCHEIIKKDKYLFDTSPFYGILKSETVLGKCLQGIDRDKYYLSSKVGRYGLKEFDYSAKRIKESVNESLARLGVDYLDILILHDVEYVDPDIVLQEALPALQQVKESGKARYIGFSCEPLQVLKLIIEKSPIQLDVVISYPHYTLLDDSLSKLFPLLKEKGIGMINASPLVLGLLTTKSSPPSWHYMTKEKLFELKQLISTVEAEYKYPIEKAALQFPTEEPCVPTTLVGLKGLEEFEFLEQILKDPIPPHIFSSIKGKMLNNNITFRDPHYYELGNYSFVDEDTPKSLP